MQLIGIIVPTVNGWPWTIQVTHIITLLVLTFFTYAKGPLRWLPVVWVVTSIVMAMAAPPDARGGWVFGLTFMAVVVALARFLLRTRRQLATSTEQTELAESQKAVLQERARIARDLHDVVAHRMSAVVVMAQTARYRIDGVGEEAAAEFDAIAGAARESLDEVRQLLGVLRSDGEAASAPSPGVGDLESLALATRRTGTTVTMEVDDTADEAGEASGLVIYRIVQESLANATRHAPGAPIVVRVAQAASGDASEIAVINTAPTAPAVGLPGAGTGIPGMIERARAVGGAATAGPMPGGGFGVHALIPNRPDRRVSTVIGSPLGVVGAAPPGQ